METTSQNDTLTHLCSLYCLSLTSVYKLDACTNGSSCQAVVDRADAALDSLRTRMAEEDIDRELFLDLDDALTHSQQAVADYDRYQCLVAGAGTTKLFSCGINALTIQTTLASVVYALGGDPME